MFLILGSISCAQVVKRDLKIYQVKACCLLMRRWRDFSERIITLMVPIFRKRLSAVAKLHIVKNNI